MAGSPQHLTLVANTPTTVTFDTNYAAIEVLNVDGAAIIYGTDDGTTPVIAATGTFVLPAAICALELTPRDDGVAHSGNTTVKLISAGTPKVSVRGL
jgi:hypothetical protein